MGLTFVLLDTWAFCLQQEDRESHHREIEDDQEQHPSHYTDLHGLV